MSRGAKLGLGAVVLAALGLLPIVLGPLGFVAVATFLWVYAGSAGLPVVWIALVLATLAAHDGQKLLPILALLTALANLAIHPWVPVLAVAALIQTIQGVAKNWKDVLLGVGAGGLTVVLPIAPLVCMMLHAKRKRAFFGR